MTDDYRDKTNYLKEYSKYSSLIFQMAAIVAAGFIGGTQLDKWLKMKGPVFMITLTVATSIVAIIHLFRTLLRK